MNKILKIYIAGPDVFRSDAISKFEEIKIITNKYNYIGLIPIDNTIDISDNDKFTKSHSKLIFNSNVHLIDKCDIIIANLEPFRGACVDDGTSWEIGYGFALGKKIYGYSPFFDQLLKDITLKTFDINKQPEYSIIENFGHPVNLMIVDSIEKSGGKIFKTFEDCLKNLNEKHAQ